MLLLITELFLAGFKLLFFDYVVIFGGAGPVVPLGPFIVVPLMVLPTVLPRPLTLPAFELMLAIFVWAINSCNVKLFILWRIELFLLLCKPSVVFVLYRFDPWNSCMADVVGKSPTFLFVEGGLEFLLTCFEILGACSPNFTPKPLLVGSAGSVVK